MWTDSDASARIEENRVVFESLLDEATGAVAQLRFRKAAVTLQSAARFAWYNHPGKFHSLRLETLAAQIGQHLPRPSPTHRDLTGHVVHVISQAYAAGGHTRLVWRWIENDRGRRSSVVLTSQQGVPVPTPLHDAVVASGGAIISLGERTSNLVARAAVLRQIAESGADTLVLHVHPYDILPSIALHDVAAKVVFLNHADHVFSVGAAVADLVADIRPAGQRLSLAARNVAPARSAIVPIPLVAPRRGDRALARERLGLLSNSCVVVSIASGYKYAGAPGDHFIDLHKAFVLAHPDVSLIVVGPEPRGRWAVVSDETGGRFRAVGMVDTVDDYYDAANVYLDSTPFASLTSLLDAAVRGLPVLALSEKAPESVLTSDDISLAGEGVHFSDRMAYLIALEVLVTSQEARRVSVGAIRAAVAEDHLSPGWNVHLAAAEEILSSARGATSIASVGLQGEIPTGLEAALVNFQAASGLSEPLWSSRLRDAPYMALTDRARLLASLPRGRHLESLKFMMPDALRSHIKRRLAIQSKPKTEHS